MSWLPRITATTREEVGKEFDDLGPAACTDEMVRVLEQSNPEILDMALKSARDIGDADKVMAGFAMFYRLLAKEASSSAGVIGPQQLPHVTPQTRDALVRKIDQQGSELFVMEAIAILERDNPELLQMAHNFALRHADYLRVMQGFALLYQALVFQQSADRARLH